MLKINLLTKTYTGKKILDAVALTVKSGDIAAVTGRSGSGKTTLLLCILGFINPDAGEIFLDGQDIGSLPIEQRQLAYLPQDYGLFPHLTVKDNIVFGLTIRRVSETEREKKVKELLALVELPPEFSSRGTEALSGGEKQRVALARALAIAPKLFLLDEPLSAIDIETKAAVGEQLRALIKKLRLPAIIITHDPADAKNLGDTIYRLENGRLERHAG